MTHSSRPGQPNKSSADRPIVRSDGAVIDPNHIYSSPGEGRIGIYAELHQFSVEPGQKLTIPITLINQGSVADNLRVTLDGLPPDWTQGPRSGVVRLTPDQQHDFRIVVRPPHRPQTRAGYYPILIRATSESDPRQTVEVKVTVWVTAFSEVSSSLTPRRIRAGETALVKIHNEGNTQEAFTVDWHDGSGRLRIEPPQAQVAVAPGESGVVEFVAAPRRQPVLGGLLSYPFTAQISTTEELLETHNGEVVARGIIPPWIPLVTLILTGLLCSILFFAVYDFGNREAAGTQAAIATGTASANLTAVAIYGGEDSDGDLLLNADEVGLGTDPLNPDTDGDGLLDGEEISWGTNPLLVDSDGDTIMDGREVKELFTSPTNIDTDGDGIQDNVDPDPVGLPTGTPSATFTPLPATETPVPSATPPASPTSDAPATTLVGGSGQIVFESQRDGNSEIYVMNADGSGQVRLTNNGADDIRPRWSPDGSQIVFESRRDGNTEIYVMNADGADQRRLTDHPGEDTQPWWSPSGAEIAFVSTRDGNSEVYVMRADGSLQTRLTDNPGEDTQPRWSPDGAKIAFVSTRDGNSEIYVMNVDGSSETRLTNHPTNDCCFAWSPNGARIVFLAERDGNSEVYVMNADGSAQTRLTDHPGLDSGPLWSPDGSRIAFLSDRDGNSEIYLMNRDGTGLTRLTSQAGLDCCFAWAPDGARLVFASDRDGNFEVYSMLIDGPDGPAINRLTNNLQYDAPAMWKR